MAKNIIVTGTSRGIGFELVQLLSKQGHNVLALSRNCKPVNNLNISNVTAFDCDISEEIQLKKVTTFIEENWKQVDVLINNAGSIVNKPFAEISMKEVEDVYRVNVLGVFALTQLAKKRSCCYNK